MFDGNKQYGTSSNKSFGPVITNGVTFAFSEI
jgi:hypothetical protein